MIHLDVLVPDTDELLDANSYGAGALLRWEWSATADGTYIEGGTVALVAGTTRYDIWDANHNVGTWYRTRVSNAGGSSFSGYTTPFQTTEEGLYLSLSQLRAFHVEGEDDALLIALDGARQDIERAVGPYGETEERFYKAWSSGDLLLLHRDVLTILEVNVDGNVIPADSFELERGRVLRRLRTGTSPGYGWPGMTSVRYLPADDLATRQHVQLQLVKQELGYAPGLTSQRIGDWAETYGGAAGSPQYRAERADILGNLTVGEVMIR